MQLLRIANEEPGTYAATFQPYLLESTVRGFIREKLLSLDATVDWGGGGEPTFYRDFPGVLAMLLDHGAFNYIHTNGTRSPRTLRISAPERVHLICSVDAGVSETYFRTKRRNYFERVWQNLGDWTSIGSRVTVKYIMKEANCGHADLDAFVTRVAHLRPFSVILDIDFDEPDATPSVVTALAYLQQELIDVGLPVTLETALLRR